MKEEVREKDDRDAISVHNVSHLTVATANSV